MSSHRESETVLPGRRPATSACLAKSACGPYSYAHLSFRHLVDCIASENKSSVQLQTTGHRTDGNRDPGNNHRNPQHSHKELSLLAKSRRLHSLRIGRVNLPLLAHSRSPFPLAVAPARPASERAGPESKSGRV